MKQKLLLIVAMALVCAGVALPNLALADAPSPANQVTLEVTIGDNGDLSIGGLNTAALGLGRIDWTRLQSQVKASAKELKAVHLVLQGELVSIDVQGQPVMKMQWTPATRQLMTSLAQKYGVQITADMQSRLEEWISTTSLDVTARFANETSKPMAINLSKPVLVDLADSGQLTVEKMPLAVNIDRAVIQSIKMGGIQNGTLCWNKGTIQTKVDGNDLPAITLDPKGVQLVTRALGLDLGNIQPFFTSLMGVDISIGGGAHKAGAICGGT